MRFLATTALITALAASPVRAIASVAIGDAFAGDAAFIVGKLTGNEALANAAVEGLSEARSTNVQMAAMLLTTTRSGGEEGGVGPGPYARESIPAGPGARPSAAQQRQINEMGNANGCHTCGTKNPGTKSGNFVGDHQPPTKLNPAGGQQRYYPQCQNCSNVQGGRVSQMPAGASPPPPSPRPWWKFW